MPEWLENLLPILLLLVVVAIVFWRLPKIEGLPHSEAFRRRRVLNWLPLGLLYAFLYWGRYNLKVSQKAFGLMTDAAGDPMMGNADFATIFGVGTLVYGVSFLLNGPLTDRIGGKKAIMIGAGGATLMNLLMGVCAWALTHQHPMADTIVPHFVSIFSVLYAGNMYFQSFGAVSIVKVNAPWFHVRERGVFGAIFGILISLGIYFAYDWSKLVLNVGKDSGYVNSLPWVFMAPAVALAVFWVIVTVVVKDTPKEAGHDDFDTADASSGDEGPQLGAVEVFKMMLKNPIIMTIATIEFCSGFLRQAIMQWYPSFASQTNAALGNGDGFVMENWGLLLCCAGILGGVVAGVISDHVFQARRGPVAAILYVAMLFGAVVLYFTYDTPAVGWVAVAMSLCVIGVHGMLSGTASMDFGGKKNVGVAVGIIDGFVYGGTAFMSLVYGQILPATEVAVAEDGAKTYIGACADPASWNLWPVAMIPMAVIGLLLATRVWNAKPGSKASAAH